MISRYLTYCLVMSLWCVVGWPQELNLFSSEVRTALSAPQAVVMTFAEQYLTKLSRMTPASAANQMAEDKVVFVDGKLADLDRLDGTSPISISLQEEFFNGAMRCYNEVSWKDALTDETIATMAFPTSYELLLGINKDEATQRFRQYVIDAMPRTPAAEPIDVQRIDETTFKSHGDTLLLGSMTDARYYYMERNRFVPIFDDSRLAFSAANLFHGLIGGHDDCRMYVEQSVYGMKTINYTIALGQWLDYCAQWGLKVYVAIEEEREDGLLALMVAQSKELGFNHLLSVTVPDQLVRDANAVLKARITPFIPIHNVKDLYKTETKNRKKVKWQ